MTIDERLRQIFHGMFGEDSVGDESSPETVKGWDSMGHLVLVSELERAFQVTFTTTEIVEMVNVRCIKEILRGHGVPE